MFEGPLHPKLVHFPIALLVTALVLDLLSRIFKKEAWHRAAVIVFVAAACSSLATLLSGLWEDKRLHLEHPLLDKHELGAYVTVATAWVGMIMLWLTRQHPALRRILFTLIVVLAVTAVTITAHWGGEMVYEYAVGVER